MAIRTTDELVKGVLLKDYDTFNSPSLTPFIRAANLTINRVLLCATEKGITLSSDELTELETWLAAHNYTSADKPYSSKSTSGASGSFQGQTGMYLESTRYGQTAMMLDPSGCLKAIGQGASAEGFWGGLPEGEMQTYAERNP